MGRSLHRRVDVSHRGGTPGPAHLAFTRLKSAKNELASAGFRTRDLQKMIKKIGTQVTLPMVP